MDQSAITVRYAKAFFSLAKEKNLVQPLKEDIEFVSDVCNNSGEFILLLESPVLKTSKKSEIITSIFEGKINEFSLKFLLLIIKNKREIYIPAICRNYLALTRKDQNIKLTQLTTATVIDQKTVEKIKVRIERELNAKVELTANVKPEIIGGLILRMEDKQFDASVATQLKKIQQKLLETEIK
jgi:F-type H+-transporting ATPase subunit delta